MMKQDTGSVWQQTIDLLAAGRTSWLAGEAGRGECSAIPIGHVAASRSEPRWNAQRITLIRRYDQESIAVCWSDPTYGRYSDQLWRMCTARRSAICALTGEKIRRGDAVFRPCPNRRHRPANADAMILASKLDGLSGEPGFTHFNEALAA